MSQFWGMEYKGRQHGVGNAILDRSVNITSDGFYVSSPNIINPPDIVQYC